MCVRSFQNWWVSTCLIYKDQGEQAEKRRDYENKVGKWQTGRKAERRTNRKDEMCPNLTWLWRLPSSWLGVLCHFGRRLFCLWPIIAFQTRRNWRWIFCICPVGLLISRSPFPILAAGSFPMPNEFKYGRVSSLGHIQTTLLRSMLEDRKGKKTMTTWQGWELLPWVQIIEL